MFEAAMRKQVRSTTASRDVQDEFAALQESMTANEYAACYQRERLPLVKFLIYRGAAPQDAFDAAQHAFVEAWRRWEQIHNPRTWLRTVAIRAVAKANQPTVPLNEQYDLADSAPLGSQVSEETMDLVAVLRRLPPLQREIMVWTIDGFTPSEIAKELGISAEAQTRGIRAA
ncbi:sigma-70 family RNA polymerase sigma factor [Micromonospora sp. NPDC005324]|uniref:sigma-70 family RNA polymerase sigma factor n=1 Tax=Micromonospora sp. NPDC005324 TaxID=3157033 RepID=UPI0033A6D672